MSRKHPATTPQTKVLRVTDRTRRLMALATAIAALAWLAALAATPPLGAQTYSADQAGPPDGLGAEAYGYFRTLDGRALLTTLEEKADPIEVEVNYPVLTGDSVWVESGSRLEIELADGSVLRLDQGTELVFETLALSPDSPKDSPTHLRLLSGEMQIYVPEAAIEIDPVLVEAENSQIYLLSSGDYWLSAARSDETRVAVRGGLAEAVTKRGSVIAREGEEIRVAGRYAPYSEVRQASREHDIELWALALEEEAYGTATASGYDDDLDPRLRYAAAPLREGGRWVWVDGRRAWRPTVRVGWRPFVDGRWVYTPSGLSWVPYERWGWVTAHYGSWTYVSRVGWHWFPGAVYSPAWVHWYWGPTHVAWIPSGYYSHHYARYPGHRWGGFRFGVYGWAGGSWDYFADWTFCSTRYFGRRHGRNYWRSGRDLARDRRIHAVPRGVITTDTRRLRPETWGKPQRIFDELETAHRTRSRGIGAQAVPNKPMPDVTEFVARSSRVRLKPVTSEGLRGESSARLESRPILRPIDGPGTFSRDNTSGRTVVRGEASGYRRGVSRESGGSESSREGLSGERSSVAGRTGERAGERLGGGERLSGGERLGESGSREPVRGTRSSEETTLQGESRSGVEERRVGTKPSITGSSSESRSGAGIETRSPTRSGTSRTETSREEPSSLRSRLQRLREQPEPSPRTPNSRGSEGSRGTERSETILREASPRSAPSERLGEAESRSRFQEFRDRLERSRRESSRGAERGESAESGSRDSSGSSRVSVPPARRVVESGRSRSRSEGSESTSSSRSGSRESSTRSAPSRSGERSSTRSSSSSRSSRSSASSSSGSRRSGSSARSSGSRSSSRSSSKGKATPKKKD